MSISIIASKIRAAIIGNPSVVSSRIFAPAAASAAAANTNTSTTSSISHHSFATNTSKSDLKNAFCVDSNNNNMGSSGSLTTKKVYRWEPEISEDFLSLYYRVHQQYRQ